MSECFAPFKKKIAFYDGFEKHLSVFILLKVLNQYSFMIHFFLINFLLACSKIHQIRVTEKLSRAKTSLYTSITWQCCTFFDIYFVVDVKSIKTFYQVVQTRKEMFFDDVGIVF